MKSILEEMYIKYLAEHKRKIKNPDAESELYYKLKEVLSDRDKELLNDYVDAFEERAYEDCLEAYKLAFTTGLLLGLELNLTGEEE